ncbi:MAG: DUF4387 family protein [Rhizobiaceae bacterium]
MAELGKLVAKVRSKNAGPFWLTVDIFCGSPEAFEMIVNGVSTDRIAKLLGAEPTDIKRFDIASLNVVKFSLPRPNVQGSIHDRDMHGASWAALISELEIN